MLGQRIAVGWGGIVRRASSAALRRSGRRSDGRPLAHVSRKRRVFRAALPQYEMVDPDARRFAALEPARFREDHWLYCPAHRPATEPSAARRHHTRIVRSAVRNDISRDTSSETKSTRTKGIRAFYCPLPAREEIRIRRSGRLFRGLLLYRRSVVRRLGRTANGAVGLSHTAPSHGGD